MIHKYAIVPMAMTNPLVSSPERGGGMGGRGTKNCVFMFQSDKNSGCYCNL